MRVYLPCTLEGLREVVARGEVASATAHAVTGALREWYVEGDAEELEHAAMLEAAEASLHLLASSGGPRRRVVVAADVAVAQPLPGGARSLVGLTAPVPLRDVVSVHVDDDEAEADVAAAVAALPAAEAGDEDAQFAVDSADGHDLLWYDVSELPDLLV